MRYSEYVFRFTPFIADATDVLVSMLGECGFETFVDGEEDDSEACLKGYVQTANVDDEEVSRVVAQVREMMGVDIVFEAHSVVNENWNKTWEENGFQPIMVDDKVVVHSTLHEDVPVCKYDVVINPCMAFGTGSHVTTRMLLKWLCEHNLMGREIIDAGCGTGILGILAMMRGAKHLLAYDIDEWSVENAKQNFALNKIVGEVRLGDSAVIGDDTCDLLIANINRNILLADMARFAAALDDGGVLLLSGFYTTDVGVLVERAAQCGLDVVNSGKSTSQDIQSSAAQSLDEVWCWIELCKC